VAEAAAAVEFFGGSPPSSSGRRAAASVDSTSLRPAAAALGFRAIFVFGWRWREGEGGHRGAG